ncbi:MAG: coenzyme F420-0:L-glutamate ligase [Erysipelotrichaceae bacterium]|nr:coenzyme F420-0:L-glutamate ligase [Erysipelotrichaceae bacterium]
MERLIGTTVRGLRAPVIKTGDDLRSIVVDTVLNAEKCGEFTIRDRDVLAVTESIVARSQGNYCTIDDIAEDVREKLGGNDIGVIFPITSRNRFAIVLRGIARGAKKIYLMLSYPSDEVGNHLFDAEIMDDKDVDPYTDVLNEEQFIELFGQPSHPFTGMNYVDYYKKLVEAEGCEVEFVFANNAAAILNYTKNVLACDIHTRFRTKKLLKKKGAERVIGMDDLMTESRNGSGYNAQYGLLGSNKATEDTVKLFPTGCTEFAKDIQAEIREKTGKLIEVMVYGDGAFKDPVGKIWELADPVVSPGYTDGLDGTPNELKLKYLADNQFADLSGEELKAAIRASIAEKDAQLVGKMVSEGTTPRRLTDLIGSLCDLTSGSGDKGTPFVYIQGYFDNYTD